jgi:hypothetical protein
MRNTATDMSNAAGENYHFDYAEGGVYGHVMRLVKAHARGDGVHLDLGCGFGAIAEKVRELDLTYVGLDCAPEGPRDLTSRGFESGTIDLLDVPAALSTVRAVLEGRPLASVTLLDTLEHITSGAGVLRALHEVALESGAPLVVSVPNVSHRDIAIKLLTGRFDYTATGLLDETHLVLYTERLLDAYMVGAGWREVGNADFPLERSDQRFPRDHVGLADGSLLHSLLKSLRDQAGPHGATNQFVRAYLPGARRPIATLVDQELDEVPSGRFLTVVVRTQGLRQETLRDALLCLQGQTNQDFEVLLVAHDATDNQPGIDLLVGQLPSPWRHRVRVLYVDGGGRARPLNAAFAVAEGRYVAVLDDDDLVFAHWVDTFAELAHRSPGSLLRSVCAVQSIRSTPWAEGRAGFTTIGGVESAYPDAFDLFDHFRQNFTPFMAWAFPRSLYRDLGLRFDESLNICEDWDFELRAALLVGVTDTDAITAVYRQWTAGSSSYSLHADEEWRRAEQAILAKLDAQPHIFPAGSISRIRQGHPELLSEIKRLESLLDGYEHSRSWQMTRPVRAAKQLFQRRRTT